ncbi:MAG: phosphoesterase [Euryarchaeota archaeon]|nr:phosphoesterase [Euryarchaeota archaeon]
MHKNADLDALASAYFLKFVYDAELAADGLDRFAKKLARELNIEIRDDVDGQWDKVITVDTASREQLGRFSEVHVDIVYDHHASNNIDAPEKHVDPSYPSCAELLYDTFEIRPPDDRVYILLMGGIITDTRWFRFANTRTFEIVRDIDSRINGDYAEYVSMFDFPHNFGERISIMKGMQRVRYRTKGSKIVAATMVSAHESSVAVNLIEIADVVFVASQRKEEVRVSARSREANLLDIFEKVAKEFGCTYGGHPEAAGLGCVGDAEAILNALLITAEKLL